MLAVQLFLNSSLFHKMKCPSWTWVKRQKRTSDRAVNGKEAKNTHFRESFVRQESCRTVTTFELAVIQWIYLFQKRTVGNAITCNEIKAIPFFFLCLPFDRPKFSGFQKKKLRRRQWSQRHIVSNTFYFDLKQKQFFALQFFGFFFLFSLDSNNEATSFPGSPILPPGAVRWETLGTRLTTKSIFSSSSAVMLTL